MNWTTNGTREDGYYGSGFLALLLFTGDGGSGPGHYIDKKRLADCIDKYYHINGRTFVESQTGSNGFFMGRDKKGMLYTVENDVGSFTLKALGVHGHTDGFSPSVNFTASDLVAKGWDPIVVPSTQIEELAHSLDVLTSGGNPFASDERSVTKFEDCVFNWYRGKRH